MSGRFFEDLLRGRRGGVQQAVFRLALAVPSLLFRLIVAIRARIWSARSDRRARIDRPVISVGNLSVGGTGKTPFVRWICATLLEMGLHPLVIGRGYGARVEGSSLDEEGASLERALPGVLVRQGSDRAAVARTALADHPEIDVIVLDDAAQTLRVARDLDIWLLDAAEPFEGGWTLPAGGLREGPGALARADLCVLTRAGGLEGEHLERSLARVRRRVRPGVPVLRADHRSRPVPPAEMRGKRLWALAGIARPEGLLVGVEAAGGTIAGSTWFPDHHAFTRDDLHSVARLAREAGADGLVCSTKDAQKLQALGDAAGGLELLVLDVEIVLADEDRRAIDQLLRTLSKRSVAREADS